jgi:hypothetical protein
MKLELPLASSRAQSARAGPGRRHTLKVLESKLDALANKITAAEAIPMMRKVTIGMVLLLGLFVVLFSFPSPPRAEPCSREWAERIARDYVHTSDDEGHGPDFGLEWLHIVEKGLQTEPLMTSDQQAHCAAVAEQIASHHYIRSRLSGRLFRLF